jgi:hypothetical protein
VRSILIEISLNELNGATEILEVFLRNFYLGISQSCNLLKDKISRKVWRLKFSSVACGSKALRN